MPDAESLFICTRFIGTTPDSSNIYQVICSIVQQIHMNSYMTMPRSFFKLKEKFKHFLHHLPPESKIVIILDAVDQLDKFNNALNFNWLPVSLPRNVKIILTATYHQGLHTKLHKLIDHDDHFLELEEFHPSVNLTLVQTLLASRNRTLSKQQGVNVKSHLHSHPNLTPLGAELIADQTSTWHSNDNVELQCRDAVSLIHQKLRLIELKYGRKTTRRALGYLSGSRYGMTDEEMLEILKKNDDLEASVNELVDAANAAGGTDNITAMLIECRL